VHLLARVVQSFHFPLVGFSGQLELRSEVFLLLRYLIDGCLASRNKQPEAKELKDAQRKLH